METYPFGRIVGLLNDCLFYLNRWSISVKLIFLICGLTLVKKIDFVQTSDMVY